VVMIDYIAITYSHYSADDKCKRDNERNPVINKKTLH